MEVHDMVQTSDVLDGADSTSVLMERKMPWASEEHMQHALKRHGHLPCDKAIPAAVSWELQLQRII